MSKLKPRRARLATALLAALLPTLVCGAASALPDVIDRPSTASERAAQSLLLTVTRAGNRLVAAGERGIVLLSDDNGKSWRQARVPVSLTLTSVHFLNEREGWLTGHAGVLLRTADGGETWSKRFDGAEVAKIILDAELAKGTAGKPEQLAEAQRLMADGPDKPLLDVFFSSPQVGFVVGAYGLFLRTDDGGKTWSPSQERLPNLKGRHLTRVVSLGGELYVVGEQGAAYLSADGGATFTELNSPYRGTFFGVVAQSADEVVIYGLRGNAFRVGRHGTEWAKLAAPAPVTYSAAMRTGSGQTILASQTGDLLGSSEGSLSLVPVTVPTRTLVAAMAEAADGAVVVAGRGISRFTLAGATGGQQ
jgi:photosystem II stability/assembly factor-like uncharacterized protein